MRKPNTEVETVVALPVKIKSDLVMRADEDASGGKITVVTSRVTDSR